MKKLLFFLGAILLLVFCHNTIKAQSNSVILIPPSGPSFMFASITSAYAAIPSNLSSGHNYIIELLQPYNCSDPTEIFPILLTGKGLATGGATITIRPSAGNFGETIQRPLPAAGDVIQINGGTNIIIDGRPGGIISAPLNYLNIVDVSTGINNNVIRLINGASYNTIQYINATAPPGNPSNGTRVITIGNSPVGQANNNNNISHNVVIGGQRGIQVIGTVEKNEGNIISYNVIKDFNYYGVLTGQLINNTTVQNNTITCSGLENNQNIGIFSGGVSSVLPDLTTINILNNYITSDLAVSSVVPVLVGIRHTGSSSANITNNIIANFSTNTATIEAISTSTYGTVKIINNTINNLFTSNGSILAISTLPAFPGSVFTASGNKITSLKNDGTGGIIGIYVSSQSGDCIYNLNNNFISIVDPNLNVYGVFGIWVYQQNNTATAPYTSNIFFNTIRIGGTQVAGIVDSIVSACIYKNDNYSGSIYNQKNNICILDRSGGTPGVILSGFVLRNTTGTLNIDYNTYYRSGGNTNSSACYWINTPYDNSQQSLYKTTAIPNEQNSNFTNVNFQSANDLHLAGASQLDPALNGTPAGGITTDIDNDFRKVTIPTRGGDENLIVIPVRFLSFNGESKVDHNKLYWATAFEIDNLGFEILHSADGINFSSVGFVTTQSNGNSSIPLYYKFIDHLRFAPNTFYKLKQIDKNQRIVYSDILKITKNNEFTFEIIKCYPNPVKKYFSVVVNSPESATISILVKDIVGNKIFEQLFEVKKGENILFLDSKYVSKGTNILSATLNKKIVSIKFIKN